MRIKIGTVFETVELFKRTRMKKLMLIMALVLGAQMLTLAQSPGGIKVAVDRQGVPIFVMEDVVISARPSKRRAKNRHARQVKKFNRLRYNILKTLPYANEAARNLRIIDAELARIPTEEGKKAYMDSKENSLFGRYEEDIKKLTISQGKVLVKLIDRQTGNTAYSLIRDYKSKTSAFFWQGIGRLFGYNLKNEYDTEDEFAMEVILKSIENGTNPTYYDYIEAKKQAGI